MSNKQPIILAEDGTPFTSEADAKKYRKDKELSEKQFKVMKEQGGWCIFDTSLCPSGLLDAIKKSDQPKPRPTAVKEKYFEVVFQMKTSPNDEDEVSLSLNGDVIILNRDKTVILPESYLEVADHAVRNHYEQKPGQTRKIVGKIRKYPYTRIKEVDHKTYFAFMKKGNEQRDRDIEKMEKGEK